MRIALCNQQDYWGGLNNNGGSLTIVKSANVLKAMGHKVSIVTKSDKLTWIKHDKPIHKIPQNADVCIAVSASAVQPMLKTMPQGARAFWWMRGIETWQMPKDKILKHARAVNMIVNAGHLQRWLAKFEIRSQLCHAGLDTEKWYKDQGQNNGHTTIGCLYNLDHPTKRWQDFRVIAAKLGNKLYRYAAFGKLRMTEKWLNCYVKQPDKNTLRTFYSKCNIWFAPSSSEGFNNTAAEAGLCGCFVIGRNCAHGGTDDYLDNTTGYRYESLQDAVEQIREPDYDKTKKMRSVLLDKIGSREQNMKRLLEILKD